MENTVSHERKEEYYALIDALPHFVWLLQPDGSVSYTNQRWRDYRHLLSQHAEEPEGFAHHLPDNCPRGKDRQCTLSHADALSDKEVWLHHLHPEDRERVLTVQRQAFAAGSPSTFEYRLRDGRTGAYRWFLSQNVPLRNDVGQIVQWVGTCTDIAEQMEHAIRESREALAVLMETVPQLVWIARPDGFAVQSNQRTVAYLNVPFEQFKGDQWLQFVHPEDRDQTWTAWQTALRTGQFYEVECRLREGQSGTYRWFLVRGAPFRDEQGGILSWFGTATDIEEQKRTEQQLKASRESLRVLTETVPQLVWVRRRDGLHEYTNQRWCDYTGLTLEHMRSDRWAHLQLIHPDDQESNRAHWQHALDTGEMFAHEVRLRNAQTGEYRWFLARGLPVRDETGQILKWFGTDTDIEEQKRAEQQLKESRESLHVLTEMMPQLVWTARPDGRVDYCNQHYCEYMQATFEQVQGYRWCQFLHPDDDERTLAQRQHSIETGEAYEQPYSLNLVALCNGIFAMRRATCREGKRELES